MGGGVSASVSARPTTGPNLARSKSLPEPVISGSPPQRLEGDTSPHSRRMFAQRKMMKGAPLLQGRHPSCQLATQLLKQLPAKTMMTRKRKMQVTLVPWLIEPYGGEVDVFLVLGLEHFTSTATDILDTNSRRIKGARFVGRGKERAVFEAKRISYMFDRQTRAQLLRDLDNCNNRLCELLTTSDRIEALQAATEKCIVQSSVNKALFQFWRRCVCEMNRCRGDTCTRSVPCFR